MNSEMRWIASRPIAHRGFHKNNEDRPENSMKSFEAAITRDFIIELDVRLLADNRVIVFHDDNLNRMTGKNAAVAECVSNEISGLKLLNTDQKIHFLEDVLDLVNGKVPLLIEIKTYEKVDQLGKAVWEILRGYKYEYAIQSFDPFLLEWFKNNSPNIMRGQLSGDFRGVEMAFYKKILWKNLLLNKHSRPAFINYDIRCMPCWAVERQRKKGLMILGWTAHSPEEYQRAQMWCDNVIFEGFDPNILERKE